MRKIGKRQESTASSNAEANESFGKSFTTKTIAQHVCRCYNAETAIGLNLWKGHKMELSYMAATHRHGQLVSGFFANCFELFKQRKIYPLQEQHPLVFRGRKYSGEEELIRIDESNRNCEVLLAAIEELDFIQPDFFFFQKNEFKRGATGIKTAGIPDLVIEVWSAANTEQEKEMRHRVYSSSDLCEHWYLTQNSNEVVCWVGKECVSRQSLKNKLATKYGVEFDLRFLAIE